MNLRAQIKYRLDFFLIAINLSGDVKNSEIYHQSRLTITQFTFRYLGPTNLLGNQDIQIQQHPMDDMQYVSMVRDT